MGRAVDSALFWACGLLVVLALVAPAHAFGAGNIGSSSRIEGTNWRHGDIEDTLLTLFITRKGMTGGRKFSKLDVKRVYFGNWLRDYSQAVDVGTVKYVSAEAVRLILWILGFMSFGFATREFEVTTERLGCYRPEEHIDNPKDYADNADARQYDRRLRAPVNERQELAIDERTGLKVYIASEDRGITTSAGMVRDLLRRCIDLARRSKESDNKDQFYEALRLLGTATHCLEDYAAHSNYVELALIEMGERDVFPHVGQRTQLQVQGARGPIYPIVTGTFGGVDFLHSVCGEVSDKATQSEIQELEGSINEAKRNQNISTIKKLLDQLPPGLIGGDDKKAKVDQVQANAASAQMQNMQISPKEPEEFTRQMQQITQQIYPVLEFHDEIMRNITEMVEKVPVLPDLIEQLQEQISIFVFSVIAPFVLPVIGQVKAELETGSSEIIQSSKNAQHIVFNDDGCTDPTHSMLSKDHFSNILNEAAGKTASQVLKWAIPQIVECWDDPRADVDRTINRIINGVFHHPALRDQGDDGARDGRQQMFGVVEQWWRQKDEGEKREFRDKLSREGVRSGRNHKEGVHDKGHGCGKPLGFASMTGGGSGNNNAIAGALYSGLSSAVNQEMGQQVMPNIGNQSQSGGFGGASNEIGKIAGEAAGGGVLGSVLGGLVGGIGGSLLGGAFEGNKAETQNYQSSSYNPNTGSQTTSYMETGRKTGGYGQQDTYGQAEYKRTDYPDGGRKEEYQRYEQTGSSGYSQRVEGRRTESGGYQRTEETHEFGGRRNSRERRSSRERRNSDDEDDYEKKERKRREKEEKKRRKKESGYGNDSEDSDDDKKYKHGSSGYGGQQESGYGRQQESSYGRQQESSYGRQESSGGYGRQQESSYGRQEDSGYGRQQESSYGRQQESSYGRGDEGYGRQEGGYGRQQESNYGRGEEGYGRSQQSGYGQSEGYGSGREERSEGYGRGSEGYGGGNEGYGDDNGRRRRNEGSEGYGSGGYGGGNY